MSDLVNALIAAHHLTDAHGEGRAREYLTTLSDTDANSLGKCLRRLGWWLPDDGQSPQERLVWWLFRDDVTRLDFSDGTERRRLETSEERLADAVRHLKSLAVAATIPSGSCLSVAGYVRGVLRVLNEKQLPLGHPFFQCGSPDDFRFDTCRIRFDGEYLNDAMNAVAIKLDLRPGRLDWQDATGHPLTTELRAFDDMRRLLTGWRDELEREIQARGELPPGWEATDSTWPDCPIKTVEHLREWLSSWLRGIHQARSSSSGWSKPESYLGDVQRELRNTRLAMREWKQPLPSGFNAKPADIHDAEEQLMLLIDGLTTPASDVKAEADGETPTPHFLGLLHQANEWLIRAAQGPPISDVDAPEVDGATDRKAAWEQAEIEAYRRDFDSIVEILVVEMKKRGLVSLADWVRGFMIDTRETGKKREAIRLVAMLSSCCRRLQEEAFGSGELPGGWEPDAEFTFPEKPIRDTSELSNYLDGWLAALHEALSDRTADDEALNDICRELRNARRAMRAWGIALPTEFNDNPADIHEAERQLELLIDRFAKPAGDVKTEATSEPPKSFDRQVETRAGGDGAGSEQAEAVGKAAKPKKRGVDRTKEELFKAALKTHHMYETGGSVLNVEPVTTRQVEELTQKGISDSTAGRLLTKHFGSVEKYRNACFSGAIGPKLVVLLGDGLHAFGSFDSSRDVEDESDDESDE